MLSSAYSLPKCCDVHFVGKREIDLVQKCQSNDCCFVEKPKCIMLLDDELVSVALAT